MRPLHHVLDKEAATKRYLTTREHVLSASNVREKRPLSTPEMKLVKAYPDILHQDVVGIGAALTESSGYVFAQMDADSQAQFLDLCFGPEGNRYSLCRLSIQSCDFSLVPRPYLASSSSGVEDLSIDDDWAYVLPLVKAAQTRNPRLSFLASPWSPPAWAKTNRSMKYGGHLRKDSYETWAHMVARAVALYWAEGVPVERITVQNEPQARQTWESCLYTPEQEGAFLGEHLRRALDAEGLGHVKALIWDHNKESVLDRTLAIVSNPLWADAVDGVAFHWYSGDHFEALRATRDVIGPNRELIFTEGCDFYSEGSTYWELPHAEHYAHEIIGDFEAGANGVLDWNILLDAHGGPNHVGNYCDAPIMYDAQRHQMNVRLPFHYIGHFSRFVQPGARHMLTTRYTDHLETAGFANPDGTHVIVVLNRTDDDIGFDLSWSRASGAVRLAHLDAPGHSIQTIVW